jgi:hypothetical protein
MKALALAARACFLTYRPGGTRVHAGSIILAPGLTEDYLKDVAARGLSTTFTAVEAGARGSVSGAGEVLRQAALGNSALFRRARGRWRSPHRGSRAGGTRSPSPIPSPVQ